MSAKPSLLYANAASIVCSPQDVVLKLAVAIGEEMQPVVTVALPLSFAARLAAQLAEALRALAGESADDARPAPQDPPALTPSLEAWNVALTERRGNLDDLAEWLIAQREQGVGLLALSQKLGIAKSTLHRFLEKRAPELSGYPRGSVCDGYATTIYGRLREGKRISQIGTELGIPWSTLNSWVKNHPLPQEA